MSDAAREPIQDLHARRIDDEAFDDAFDDRSLNHHGMVFMGGRPVESLDGDWGFLTDAYDAVMRRGWHLLGPVVPEEWTEPWEFDFDVRGRMAVPGCWNAETPELFHYEGTAWYFRTLSYRPRTPGERVFLRIGAAQYDTKIVLNRRFLGNHYGGSTPFFVELTGKLGDDNELLIGVNNQRTADRVPMRNTDWFNYGGIHREVSLVRVPPVHITDLFVYLVPDGRFGTVAVEASVSDPAAAGNVTVAIPDLSVTVDLPVRNGRAEGRLDVSPTLWSPANPKLYEIEARFAADRVTDRVGFREIRVDGTKILLNGESVYLRGISVHEDDDRLGRVTGEADIRRRYRHVRALNGNFVRLAHYPHHELAARIADEEGLLLWEEIPVYWAIDFDNPATYTDAENQLVELIKRDRNRASVILWSVGNENADTDPRLSFMTRLAETARTWDPTRPITAACLVNQDSFRIDDRLAEHLDVIGLNEYYGWYSRNFDELDRLLASSDPGKPVIISEFGAGALAGLRGPDTQPFTEDFMDRVYREQMERLLTADYVRGLSPWILYDFRSPRRQNRYQRGWNRKGLIGQDKETRKMAFDTLAAYYLILAEN